MRNQWIRQLRGRGVIVLAGLVLAAVLNSCGLDEIVIPEPDGPSELSLALNMTAVPDVITADGFSTSLITATLRDQNGRPVAGRDIFFTISDASGTFADIGSLRTSNGPGTGATVRTDSQGNAQIIYQAPARTDATANQFVQVSARPFGTDAKAANYRVVAIELRQAEPRLFAPNPNNSLPSCGFTLEAAGGGVCTPGACVVKINQQILVQSNGSDSDGTIVRYFWDFGNGRQADSPDAATSYSKPGTYVITHVLTDNNGGQSACQAAITVK